MADPLVSCLCVTRAPRWPQLQRAILDFAAQDYANKELLIVLDRRSGLDGLLASYLAGVDGAEAVRVVRPTFVSAFEGLLYALSKAEGDLLTFWDDDNLNHPGRLSLQVARQRAAPEGVTAFHSCLYYFHEHHELFVVDHFAPDGPPVAPGAALAATTVMGARRAFPLIDQPCRARPAEQALGLASDRGLPLALVTGAPYDHLVGVAGDNLRGYDYLRTRAQNYGRAAAALTADRAALAEKLDAYCWDADTVAVVGRDGAAFAYAAKNRWPAGLDPIQVKATGVVIDESHGPPAGGGSGTQ